MAQYFEPTTDTDANFANSVSGQANSYFLPAIYSKKVLNFFRKASVAEAITNTDYEGEISAFGDSVRIIKEPVISVSSYTRGSNTTATKLTDQEVNLVVDTANAFKFIVDDIETSMSHVNFKEVAASSAAYALRDAFDAAVIAAGFAGLSASSPDHIIGADAAAGAPTDRPSSNRAQLPQDQASAGECVPLLSCGAKAAEDVDRQTGRASIRAWAAILQRLVFHPSLNNSQGPR